MSPRPVIAALGCLILMLIVEPQGSGCNAFSSMYRVASSFMGDSMQVAASSMSIQGRSQEETTTSRPKTTEKSKKSDAEEIKDDFESQCLLSRGANMKRPPKVFSFSSKDHDEDTLGCVANTVITLGLDASGSDLGEDPNKWRLDTSSIQQLLIDSGSYDKKAPSYLLVHGFLSSWNGDTWMCKLKDKILNETQANVFIVDWSGGSKPMLPIDYGAAVANTKYVGQLLAKFLLTLLEMTNQSDATKFHLIGHSLGAHISGFVGYALGDTPLGRITGLDPAGPCFSSNFGQNSTELSETGELSGGRKRLSAQCANLVVAIHTDAGKFGLDENCGHYDVYVNGGSSQPTCVGQSITDRVESLLDLRLIDVVNIWDIACPHGYSHQMTQAYLPLIYKTIVEFSYEKNEQQYEFDAPEKQCFLMAHRCASWKAYKKGECGLVAGGGDRSHTIDALAMDPQMNPVEKAEAAVERAYWNPTKDAWSESLSDEEDADDEQINGDEDQEPTQQSGEIAEQTAMESYTRYRQHYLKTSLSKSSICAFSYQMVIAVEPIDSRAEGKLYVNIPLGKEVGLKNVRPGGKKLDRLVQVSHRVGQNSWARKQLNIVSEKLTENSDLLDYYTALITFDAASREECRGFVESNSTKVNRKRWYLCQAISHTNGARLWSNDAEALGRVRWVAMAYLSGSNSTIRHDNSYLFELDMDGIVEGKPEHATTNLRGENRKGLVNQVLGGVKCLTSAINPLHDSSCGGRVNLEYSAPLKVVRDGNKRQALHI